MSQPPFDLQNTHTGQNFVDLSDAIRDAQTLGNPSLLDIVNQLNTNLQHAAADLQQVAADLQQAAADQSVIMASLNNIHKRSQNRSYTNEGHSFAYMPEKTIAGSGQALAQSLAPELSVIVPPLDPSPTIGSIYALNLEEVDDLTHLHILRLITFYNHDLGILVGDDLDARRRKFRLWLMY